MRRADEKPQYQVAAGVLQRDGKILISKRRKGSHLEGFWEFPGGKREQGESLEECLKRELFEELGIRVSVGPRIAAVPVDYPLKRIVLYGFCCTLEEGEPRALEHQRIKWVSPLELARFKLPPPDVVIARKLAGSRLFESWMKG